MSLSWSGTMNDTVGSFVKSLGNLVTGMLTDCGSVLGNRTAGELASSAHALSCQLAHGLCLRRYLSTDVTCDPTSGCACEYPPNENPAERTAAPRLGVVNGLVVVGCPCGLSGTPSLIEFCENPENSSK